MKECDKCGTEESMPYTCRRCSGTYCSKHRLPENHSCSGDSGEITRGTSASTDSSGVVDSFANALPFGGSESTPSVTWFDALGRNVTFVFLALMWITFLAQLIVANTLGDSVMVSLFVLHSDHIAHVWTWVTSIFAHGGFTHILLNSIVLYFFGPVVERRVGSRRFAALFLIAGVLAGLAQIVTAVLVAPPAALPSGVVGASGAIMAVMGVLTALDPHLRVYLWFIVPVPLWVVTFGFAGYSVFIGLTVGVGAGGVAQFAHLAGIVVGLIYGVHLDRNDTSAPSQIRFGGGGSGRRRF